VQPPDQPVDKIQNSNAIKEEHLKTEKEPEIPVLQKAPAEIIESESSFQLPTIFEKKIEQPADIEEEKSGPASEVINPAYQIPLNSAEDLKPEDGRTAKVQEFATQEQKGVHLTGTIQMAYPRYQLNSPPAYPHLARKRAQEGTVILQVLVNRDGRVGDLVIDVSSNFTLLDRAAITAVRKWSFEPGRRGEERVPMWVRVPVTFKLNE
jgi:protein TonB